MDSGFHVGHKGRGKHMRKILFVLAFLPSVSFAQNVYFPTAQTLVLPTGWTTVGTSKATTTACALTTSYAMKNGNASVQGGYVPIVLEQPGLIGQIWGHVLSYFGPGKDFSGDFPLVSQQIIGAWYEQKTWGTGARYITATVVDWGSLGGNTCASQLVQGYDGTIAPWRSFVTGKFYRRYDVELQNTFCNTCSPTLACGSDGNDGEVWASLWSGYTCSVELVTELPVGGKVLDNGVAGISPGFSQPYPENYGSIPGQSEDGITDTYPQADEALQDYLDTGSIIIENDVDITSITIIGDSGFDDRPVTYEQGETSVTVIVNSSVTVVVNISTMNFNVQISTDDGGALYQSSVAFYGAQENIFNYLRGFMEDIQDVVYPSSGTIWDGCFDLTFNSNLWGANQSYGRIVCIDEFGAQWAFDLLKTLLLLSSCWYAIMILWEGI